MMKGEPRYMGEMWFGNAPYGAHGTSESLDSVAITELCINMDPPNCLNGFWFCPVLYSIQLPDWVVEARKDRSLREKSRRYLNLIGSISLEFFQKSIPQ